MSDLTKKMLLAFCKPGATMEEGTALAAKVMLRDMLRWNRARHDDPCSCQMASEVRVANTAEDIMSFAKEKGIE